MLAAHLGLPAEGLSCHQQETLLQPTNATITSHANIVTMPELYYHDGHYHRQHHQHHHPAERSVSPRGRRRSTTTIWQKSYNLWDKVLYGIGDVVIWGYAENGVGVIVGCISTLRPLFRSVFGLGGSSNGAYSDRQKTGGSRATDGTGKHYKGSEFEMNRDLPRPDKARAVTTVHAPIDGRTWNNPRHSMSGSEEELVRDLKGGIRLERSVDQNSAYGIAR